LVTSRLCQSPAYPSGPIPHARLLQVGVPRTGHAVLISPTTAAARAPLVVPLWHSSSCSCAKQRQTLEAAHVEVPAPDGIASRLEATESASHGPDRPDTLTRTTPPSDSSTPPDLSCPRHHAVAHAKDLPTSSSCRPAATTRHSSRGKPVPLDGRESCRGSTPSAVWCGVPDPAGRADHVVDNQPEESFR
jgi:hypothetical protein